MVYGNLSSRKRLDSDQVSEQEILKEILKNSQPQNSEGSQGHPSSVSEFENGSLSLAEENHRLQEIIKQNGADLAEKERYIAVLQEELAYFQEERAKALLALEELQAEFERKTQHISLFQQELDYFQQERAKALLALEELQAEYNNKVRYLGGLEEQISTYATEMEQKERRLNLLEGLIERKPMYEEEEDY